MDDFGFKFIPKAMFFDRRKVIDAVSKGTRLALSKAGAFIRTRARSSMRRRKRPSAPGHPPSSHTGDLKKIYFALGPGGDSVVVGPVRFKKGEAPALNEFGGTVVRQIKGKRTRMRYAKRPFMGPSLKEEIAAGNVSSSWSNVVKGN